MIQVENVVFCNVTNQEPSRAIQSHPEPLLYSSFTVFTVFTSDHPSFAGHLRTPWERLPSLSVRSLPPGNGSIAGIHWWESPWWHLRRVSWSTRSCWMPRSIWQMGQHGTAKIRYGRFETDWEWVEDNWIGWTSTHTTYHWTCQNLQVAGFGGKYSATHSVWLQPLFGRQLSCHVMYIYIYSSQASSGRHGPAARGSTARAVGPGMPAPPPEVLWWPVMSQLRPDWIDI